MPLPKDAVVFPEALDPADTLDFYLTLSQGAQDASPPPILLTGESVASMMLAPTAEAVAAGLTIKSGGGYPAPAVDTSNVLSFWAGVVSGQQNASVFDDGVDCGVVLTITTNNNPPRVKQRTMVIRVQQR